MDGPLTRGILDLQLLRKLWLGENTNIDFLVNLMVHIGVVAILPIADSNGFQRFLVPAMITEQMNVGDFSESKVLLKYLNITSVDGEYRISFRFDQDFTPAAYYNRVVTRLADGISTYGNGSIECVFLNASFTYGLAKLLKERYRVRWILSWETEIDDEAAMCFAEAFYHFLGCL